MRTLSIDIETFSSIDLRASGLYKYVESEDFEILLFAYAYDDEPVTVIDLAQGSKLPPQIIRDLTSDAVLKTAWNAQFERVCLSRYIGQEIPINQWEDSMVLSAMNGYPLGLDQASEVIDVGQRKDRSGTLLINFFSKPCKATRANGERTRNLPHHDLDKWQLYKQYNAQDVMTERALRNYLLDYYRPSEFEKKVYEIDQRINDYGAKVDWQLVSNIVQFHENYLNNLLLISKTITGLDNPQSLTQLKEWLQSQGLRIDTLRKDDVEELLNDETLEPHIRQVLENRQELGKTSVKKYDAILNASTSDERVHGLLQYYGANRTGRWAGRLVQIQNLPRNYMSEIPEIRELIKEDKTEALDLIYDNVTDIFSQLIRTAFIPTPGHTFYICDYSAIEARVIAWLAQEEWLMKVFDGDGKVYEATASRMFDVPLSQVDSDLRQKGKVATLALGYQGGVRALEAMGALRMGLDPEELPDIVSKWRRANPAIVELWKIVEEKIKHTILNNTESMLYQEPYKPHVRFYMDKDHLVIELPSKRQLRYVNAQVEHTQRGSKITYEGLNQTTRQWKREDSYGGKFTENIVQAIARDCLAEALVELSSKNFKIVFHVHDEIVAEIPHDKLQYQTNLMNYIMSNPIVWAQGLKLPAEGFTSDFYTKD